MIRNWKVKFLHWPSILAINALALIVFPNDFQKRRLFSANEVWWMLRGKFTMNVDERSKMLISEDKTFQAILFFCGFIYFDIKGRNLDIQWLQAIKLNTPLVQSIRGSYQCFWAIMRSSSRGGLGGMGQKWSNSHNSGGGGGSVAVQMVQLKPNTRVCENVEQFRTAFE